MAKQTYSKNQPGGYPGLSNTPGTPDGTKFLRDDGTWQTPPGGGVTDGDKGDVTVTGGGATWTIDAGVVTTAKMGGDVTTAGKALLDDANAAAQRTTLGLGTAALNNTGDFDAAGVAAAGDAAHVAAGDPHPQYLTAAEGDAAYAPLVHAARHELGGADPIKLDDLDSPDDNTDLNATTDAHGLLPKLPGGTTTFLRGDGTFAAPPGGPGGGLSTVEANLGATPATRGKFTLTDAAISPSSKIAIWQAPGPYTGKGTRADESEMDYIQAHAEPGSGQATVRWVSTLGVTLVPPNGSSGGNRVQTSAPYNDAYSRAAVPTMIGKVKGNVKFFYMVT